MLGTRFGGRRSTAHCFAIPSRLFLVGLAGCGILPLYFPIREAAAILLLKLCCGSNPERFNGAVTWYRRGASGVAYRLWFEDALRYALADAFIMSHMRDLEARLRAASEGSSDVEQEIPFWEFLDIEFDQIDKAFDLTAYYVQKPSFPELFRHLAEAPPLKRILDELAGKAVARIHKQKWKPRSEFETEIGATNVIYMLADTVNRLLYVGEANALIPRFRRGHELIPDWNYYRYSALPQPLAEHRLQLERMIIRDLDAVFGETAAALPVAISNFKLVNLRIDR